MVELVQRLAAAGGLTRLRTEAVLQARSLSRVRQASAKKDLSGMEDGARVDLDEYEKDSARDFALWKAAKTRRNFVGYGHWPRAAGMHLECSAMAMEFLGESSTCTPAAKT